MRSNLAGMIQSGTPGWRDVFFRKTRRQRGSGHAEARARGPQRANTGAFADESAAGTTDPTESFRSMSADFSEAALAGRKIRESNSAIAADHLKTRAFDDMQLHPEARRPIPFPGGPAIRSGGSVESGQSVGARNSAGSGNSAGLGPLIRAGQDDALDTGDDVRLIAQIADGQSDVLSELYRRRGGAHTVVEPGVGRHFRTQFGRRIVYVPRADRRFIPTLRPSGRSPKSSASRIRAFMK